MRGGLLDRMSHMKRPSLETTGSEALDEPRGQECAGLLGGDDSPSSSSSCSLIISDSTQRGNN